MSKRFVSIIALMLMASLVLSACGGASSSSSAPAATAAPAATEAPAAPAAPAEPAKAEEPAASVEVGKLPEGNIFIRNTCSAMGGTWYPMASAMNLIWEANIPNVYPKVIPGSSVENVKLVADKDTEIGWMHSIGALDGINGVEPYNDGKDYGSIAHITTLTASPVHVVVHNGIELESLADINGLNVAVAMPGTSMNAAVEAYLAEEFGVTPETITAAGGTWLNLAHPDAISMLQDNQLDVWFIQSAVNDFQEILSCSYIYDMPKETVDDFLKNHPTWSAATLPADLYNNGFLDHDYYTFSSYVILAVPNDLNEELVYELTKYLWENIDKIYEISSDARRWAKLENAALLKDQIPLHAGAERYYKEIGII